MHGWLGSFVGQRIQERHAWREVLFLDLNALADDGGPGSSTIPGEVAPAGGALRGLRDKAELR